ncbi:amino acid/polyamine transporter I [Aspergillus novoparasiticus]|uniref:Amino acid/polyamine transporter I n=1 Tax=Aspergillus novoparasiticus TaxID=986946 RepID=A0A5N6ELK0_9EURO|nr:amino acid/polyamine transporter I [Aspergillus novoparasiticus]
MDYSVGLDEDSKSAKVQRAIDDSLEHTITSNGEGVIELEVRPKVHFNLFSALGQQYSITAAPLAIGVYLSLVTGLGGPPGYFWGFILVGFFQFIVCLAVGELASATPHSSGPAYWVIALSDPRYAHTLGFIMGWLTNAGWYFICCASCLYPAQIIMALVEATNPGFTATAWQTYLVYIAFALLYLGLNLPRVFWVVGWLLKASIVLINVGAVFLLIALPLRAHPKQNARDVFVNFINASGWKSDGWAFFLALLPAYACLAAFDNATHLTDELEQPGKQVPQVMIGSFLLSFFLTIPMILIYEFCNVDPESMLEPVGGQPIIQLFVSAYRSETLTIISAIIILIVVSIGGAATLIGWSRLYWSFSREGLLPFSRKMSELSSKDSLPINALVWGTFLMIALGAISIGSSIAMNALLGGANLCIIISVVASFGLVLKKGRRTLNPDRWLNLGRWGDAVFLIAFLWCIFISTTFCFPLSLPVTAASMNWTTVVFFGIIALAAIHWIFVFSESERPLPAHSS